MMCMHKCVCVLCMCVVYVHVYVHTSTCEHVKEEDYVHMSVLCAHTCMGQELHSQNQSRVEEREREGRLTNSINKVTHQGNCQAHNINQWPSIPQPAPQGHFLRSMKRFLSALCYKPPTQPLRVLHLAVRGVQVSLWSEYSPH